MGSFYGNGGGGSNFDPSTLEIIKTYICGVNQYDSTTGLPTISDPDLNTFYLVPGDNGYNEYYYKNGNWELFGSADNKFDLSDRMAKGNGTGDIIEGAITGNNKNQASGQYSHAEGITTKATKYASHTEGSVTTASGYYSHAEGYSTTASGTSSHAEGGSTKASGEHSHAEGGSTKALKQNSHAEGNFTTGSGISSHAEGNYTTASGGSSHAEGNYATASGGSSHAEGNYATASGSFSHAEGNYTTASHKSQHVFGEFNVFDNSTAANYNRGNYIEIVGNGTESTRSNARTLDWSGNEKLAGSLTLGMGTGDETTMTAAQLKTLLSLASAEGVEF